MRRARLMACDVAGLVDPDLATVDALARLQLLAGRYGLRVRLVNVPPELRALLLLAGLAEVFDPRGSGVQARRETEERKEASGVEEEGDGGDPVA